MARLLLDENMPRLLVRLLKGHHVSTVQESGWSGVKNGELLRRAVGSFDVFLTMDRSIPFQQSVAGLTIAVLIVRARNNRPEVLEPLAPSILEALLDTKPGTVSSVGDWP